MLVHYHGFLLTTVEYCTILWILLTFCRILYKSKKLFLHSVEYDSSLKILTIFYKIYFKSVHSLSFLQNNVQVFKFSLLFVEYCTSLLVSFCRILSTTAKASSHFHSQICSICVAGGIKTEDGALQITKCLLALFILMQSYEI
jgi:hypothetical protein